MRRAPLHFWPNRFTALVCAAPRVHGRRVVEEGRAGCIAASILPISAGDATPYSHAVDIHHPSTYIFSLRPLGSSTRRTDSPSTTPSPRWLAQVVRRCRSRLAGFQAVTSAVAVIVSPRRTGLTNFRV